MSSSVKKRRILVVEDEAIVVRDIERQLREQGYEPVGEASRGDEAIALTETLRPDLVLMDIRLSGDMDGIATASAIRARFSIPVVFLTAFAEASTLERAKLTDPFGYILKPFSERELHTVIEMALFKHAADLKVQQSEERLRLVLRGSTDGVWDRDLISHEVFYSDRWWEMIGYAPNELPLSSDLWRSLMHPDDRDRVLRLLAEALEGTTSTFDFEARLRHKAGHYVPILSRGLTLRDATGRAIRLLGTNTDLTARKRAEEKLRVSDQALKAISQGVIICGGDRRIIATNAAFAAITGYGETETLGRNPGFLWGPKSDPAAREAIRCAIEDGVEYSGEVLNYRKDGTTFWNDLTISPIHDEYGALTYYISVIRDVTARRQAEAAMRHRNAFLAGLGQIVRDLLAHRELDELLPATAEQVAKTFDAQQSVIYLREGDALVSRATWNRDVGALASNVILTRGGTEPAWVAFDSGRTLRTKTQADGVEGADPAGTPASLVVLHVPITLGTEHLGVLEMTRRAEELDFSFEEHAEAAQLADVLALILHNAQLLANLREDIWRQAQTKKKIKESELRLASIIDSAMDAIITVDARQQIVIFNPAAEAMFRFPRAQAIGQPLDRFIPARFRSGHRRYVEHFASSGHTGRAMGNPGVVHGLRADGDEFPLEASISQVNLGEESLFTVILRDVSVQERIEREKRGVEAQLRQSQKLEAIGQLSGGIAHDFNNLLTAILGSTAILQDDHVAPAIQKELLQQISKAGNRAASLTRQLLLFSRRTEPVRHDLDLNQVVTEMLKMLRRILGENFSLDVAFAAQPQMVNADAGMLDQIILNLSVNARDAMPQGGKLIIGTETVTIASEAISESLSEWRGVERRVRPDRRSAGRNNPGDLAPSESVARAGTFVCLRVTDHGCGMPPEVLEHIFEPFFTTKEQGQGTGLGLATVYGIVQQHHGWIEVDTEVGVGTTFRVYLPAIKTAPAPAFDETPTHLKKSGRGETILVVEDEHAVRSLLCLLLQRSGYHVLEAASGVAAQALWPEHRKEIRLLITDLVMPDGVSGADLAKALLVDRPDLRIIFISGYSPTLGKDRKTFGFDVEFISKPFELQHVLAAVRTQLDARLEDRSG